MMHFNIKQFYFNNAGIIDSLNANVRNALLASVQQRKFKPGKVIYREGKIPTGVYIVRKGKVKIYQTGQDGVKQIMYIYMTGEMFGFRPLLCDEKHPVSAVAFDECVCDFIPAAPFLKCVSTYNELCRALLVSVSYEFTVWVNRIGMFARYPVKSRVALALLILQEKFRTKERSNEVPLTRSDLAGYVGTVKEMVVRAVQDMKLKKIVETQGSKIRILKPEELKRMVRFF